MIDVHAVNQKKKKKKSTNIQLSDSYVHSIIIRARCKQKYKNSINQSPQLLISSDSYSALFLGT